MWPIKRFSPQVPQWNPWCAILGTSEKHYFQNQAIEHEQLTSVSNFFCVYTIRKVFLSSFIKKGINLPIPWGAALYSTSLLFAKSVILFAFIYLVFFMYWDTRTPDGAVAGTWPHVLGIKSGCFYMPSKDMSPILVALNHLMQSHSWLQGELIL